MNTYRAIHPKKMSDAEAFIPGFARLWKHIKAITGTKQARPKSISVTTAVETAYAGHDASCLRRFGVELATMQPSDKTLHVSVGEWACHGQPNNDQAIVVPAGFAVVDVEWNDYYRSLSVRIQVAPTSELAAHTQAYALTA